MTLDAVIDSTCNGEHRNRLLKKRFWLAMDALGEGELDDIASSLAVYADLEEPDDFACGFWDFIHAETNVNLNHDDRNKPTEPMELHQIEVCDPIELLNSRKKAFHRLWIEFEDETKRSFLTYANLHPHGGK